MWHSRRIRVADAMSALEAYDPDMEIEVVVGMGRADGSCDEAVDVAATLFPGPFGATLEILVDEADFYGNWAQERKDAYAEERNAAYTEEELRHRGEMTL